MHSSYVQVGDTASTEEMSTITQSQAQGSSNNDAPAWMHLHACLVDKTEGITAEDFKRGILFDNQSSLLLYKPFQGFL